MTRSLSYRCQPTAAAPSTVRCRSARGFILTEDDAQALLATDPTNAEVVRPFLTGSDIVEEPAQHPRRWCIDFGVRTLEQASRFPGPLAHLRHHVKHERESNHRAIYRQRWWLFGEPCRELRAAIAPLPGT